MCDNNKKSAGAKYLLILPVSLISLVATTAQAQFLGLDPDYGGTLRPYGVPAASTGSGVKVGESSLLYPAVGISATRDDNRYRSEYNAQSTTRYNLKPVLAFQGGVRNKNWTLGYIGNYATYSSDGVAPDGTKLDDDYDDHNVNASFSSTGSKARGKIYADYQQGHDERGENIGVGFDIWDQNRVLGDITFGAIDATFNFRLDGAYITRKQETNQSLNKDMTGIGGVLLWRVSGKTQLVAEAGYKDYVFEYTNGDYSNTYLRGGITWEATGKTSGIFTIGSESVDPDNPGVPIVSTQPGPTFGYNQKGTEPTWKGIINWTPTQRDLVSITSNSGSRLSNGTGSSVDTTLSGISWNHDWAHHIGSSLAYSGGTNDYKGADRKDDITLAQAGISYKPTRKMLLSAYWYYEQRDSNIPGNSYDRNLFQLLANYEF